MPSRCWILGCPSNVDRSNTKFFKFPQDEVLKQLWIDAIKRDVAPTDFSRVCSKHFKPGDVLSLDSGGCTPYRLKLANGAVPCIFEGLVPRKPRKKSSPKCNNPPEETIDSEGEGTDSEVLGRICSVPGCKSNSKGASDYTTVFKFPADPDRRQLWIEKSNRENFKPSPSSVVCIKHFEESCIIREDIVTQDDGNEMIVPRLKFALTADALPTIFEDIPSTPKKKRVMKKRKEVSKSEENCIDSEVEIEKETLANDSSINESINKSDDVSNNDSQDEEDKETSISDFLSPSAIEREMNLNRFSTTDKPIITVLKAQAEVERPISDEEEIIPLEQLKSPIIKSNLKKIPNELPSPYKHLPAVSVCLKEEDRVILTQDESKSLKRSSSIGSNSNNSAAENAKSSPLPKRRKIEKPAPLVIGRQNDAYCWVCHRENIILSCIACPRAYHLKCAGEISDQSDWVCLECRRILTAENVDTRSSVLSEISLDKLCALLRFCLNKTKHRAAVPFHNPVSLELYPMYLHYVIHPMDFSLLEKNIKQKLYGCTEAFLADVKWILHNSCVFNGSQHALSSNARGLVKTCENDMQEIEICPDCFMHSVIRNKYWFADVCRKPHPLVWAKLKGFPYWPAKVVRILDGNVDARFFGAHDRAWVPINQCYHLSKETPTTSKPKKKGTYEAAIDELNVHVQLLIQKFGTFDYAKPRTVFDPKNKKLMYHGIDIDKVDKEEIPFDPTVANNKEFCPSPTDERRMSLDSKMDVDQCEEASSSSMVSAADTRISQILSCDDEKEVRDKTESKVQESVSEKNESLKEIDLTLEDSSKSQSKSTSNVARDKLEKAFERIKGYVSLDAEEEKESSKEDEPEKPEPVKKTNISSEGTTRILANLIKSKSLPKIDLPDIPAVEEDDTVKEKESFLDVSKKNDTFTLHLLETIKKAKSRAAADDEEEDSDMETDEEDSDSDSVVDEENEEGKEAVEENESEEHEGEIKEAVETASASEEEGDDTESGSENESSSETSGTDIEEVREGSSSISKNAEKNSENEKSNHRDNEVAVSSVNTEKSDPAMESNDPQESTAVTITNNGDKSVERSPKGKLLDKSSEIEVSSTPSNKMLDVQHFDEAEEQKEPEDSELNLGETNDDEMEDDEVIICPPVKAPTPPLICLDDDGTETESDNDCGKKAADSRDMLSITCTTSPLIEHSLNKENLLHKARETPLEKNSNSILIQPDQPAKKNSVVRFLKFSGNDVSLSREKSQEDPQRNVRRNNKRPRIPVSSSDDESSDDGLIIDRNTGVPLRGARRTFNRPNSTAKSNGAADSNQEICESTVDDLECRSDKRRNSVDNSLAESSLLNEPRITLEQSMLSDGSNQENNAEKGPLDPKDEEIMRLKKKFATLFTAFRLQHWKNTQEKLELKHNMNLIIMEMRASLEADKKQAIETLSRTFERFKQKAIDEVKRNQWCAFCLKEARYQCCWNTNYCSINCQKRNFPIHKKSCTQLKNKPNSTVISDSTPTNEPKDNKKVFVVNMVPKSDAKSQVQIVPANSNVTVFSTSSANTVVPSTNVQYILAQPTVKANNSKTTHEVSSQEEKQASMGSSDINPNSDLSTSIALLNKTNTETAGPSHTKENKTNEPDLEEIYFPSPPQVCFEGLDFANADESIQISQIEASEKNSSDTDIVGQEEKKGESSAEDDINFSDDEADNEQVSIGNGIEVKAKFLNKCLIYGKTAKRLTRCLVDVLFPDLKQLATCSAFGQKSNVTKLTRAALPGKKVNAILEFVQKRFPTATRTEIVLAINMKCKEARNIVDKQDGEKPVKRTLFRRLLARDQSLEVNKTTSTATINTSVAVASSTVPSVMTKAPIMIMRQPPPNQSICIKASQLTSPLTSETITSPTKVVNVSNILRCTPQVLIKPKFTQIQPRLPQKTIRTLLPSPQPIGIAPREPTKYILPREACKQSISPQTSTGRPYIIIGSPAASSPQSLPVTQPSSMPANLPRK